MKKGLLVLAVLALAASAWAGRPVIGGSATAEFTFPPRGGGSFIPTDSLSYTTLFRDRTGYYITGGNNYKVYAATRFTPPYTGTVDSAMVALFAPRAFSSAITDTLFFYKDTLNPQQPGSALNAYTFSFTPTGRFIFFLKLNLSSSPFPMSNGVDFWAGTMGLQRTPGSPDSLKVCMDTSTTTVADRQWIGDNGRALADWSQCSPGLPFDWGITLYANVGSGVELLTPGGSVSLPPRLYPASPNPFRGAGEIAYDLPKAARVELAIHDLSGRLVRTLVVGERNAGHHAVRWDGKDAIGQTVASGVYLYTLRAGSLSATRSLVVVR